MSALETIARIGSQKPSDKEISLRKAWSSLKSRTSSYRRTNTSGCDCMTMNDFALNETKHIKELSNKLKSKTYKFNPLKVHLIPKGNGKDRVICIPTVMDRIVQRSALLYLEQRYAKYGKDSDISYGLKGVHEAVKNGTSFRKTHPYVYKTDVSSFFDKIERTRLEKEIKSKISARSLHWLLIAASRCEIEMCRPDKMRKIEKAGIKIKRGVRQGMPLSPFFANLFLADFDAVMVSKSKELNFKAIRYVDDLIFFAKDEDTCHKIHELCKLELEPIGLGIPPLSQDGKTRIYKPEEDSDFLGIALRRKKSGAYDAIIPEKQRLKIKERIMNLSDIAYLDKQGITITKVLSQFKNMTAGYAEAYKMCKDTEISSLINSMNQWYKKSKHKLYENLGLDVGILTDKQKLFLELKDR